MTTKNFWSRWWLEVTFRYKRMSTSRNASTAFARPVVPTKLNYGRVRLGAIVFPSALGLALSGIVLRATLMAAPVDVAPTWGKVLIAGGFDDIYGTLSSTELYDPATNSFAAPADTATMNEAREGATATLWASGKVLIAGGSGDGSTELYDPATNNFAAPADTATMNVARAQATATLLPSGKVLIAGGSGSSGLQSSIELYDPATNSFAAPADTATMNTARFGATATLLTSGKVLIAGGFGNNGKLSSTELYDPATNSFAAPADTATMNVARYLATATLLASGKVLIAGGPARFNHALSSTELYRPANNSFARSTKTATMNTPRDEATATLVPSGKVVIAGGALGKASLDTTELYDPTTNSFAVFADTARMNNVRAEAVAVLLPNTLTPGLATLLPATLDFGTIKVGQSSAPSSVTLSNGTGQKVTIRGIAVGIDYKVAGTTWASALNAGESCYYVVSFQPQSAGTKNEHFRVFDNGPHSPQKVNLNGIATR